MPATAPVVFVEDDESDALLLKLAMKQARVPNRLVLLRDGRELLDYLAGDPPFADRRRFPLPALVLLDLRMPRIDGFQVLSWLACRPEFRDVPTVVLTASTFPADVQKAAQLGARDFLQKPSDFATLVEMARALHQRWLSQSVSLVSLPDPKPTRPASSCV